MKTDLTYLKNMSAGNKDLVLEMIGIFKNQVLEFTTDMENLLNKKEYEKLGKLAHKAKSSISIMGLNELASELKTFENLAKAGVDIEKYPIFINKFKEETNEAISELNEVSNNIDIYFKNNT
jgi:HPt (histidine-containing phosphotransfer) domain-containing protein